jgi:hypothetical protein
MDHDPLLQLADMTVGVCADFVKWTYSGRNFQWIKDIFPLVHRRLRTAFGFSEFQTGFVASPYPFRRHLEAKYNDFGDRDPTIKSALNSARSLRNKRHRPTKAMS